MIVLPDYAAARFHMIEGQVRPNKVTDAALIEALSVVPREQFVPDRLRAVAYVDEAIAIGNGRYLVEPMVSARLLDVAAVQAMDKVLVVGAGTGYLIAVLARIAGHVTGLESQPAFVAAMRERFQGARPVGGASVDVVEGPLDQGWPAQAPYDVIVIDGGAADIPSVLLDQLAEGGRLVGVVRRTGTVGQARLFQRNDAVISSRTLFEAATPVLPELAQKAEFVF